MMIANEKLEYWGELFVKHGLSEHMTFFQFMGNPELYYKRLVTDQEQAGLSIQKAFAGVYRAMDALDAEVDALKQQRLSNRLH